MRRGIISRLALCGILLAVNGCMGPKGGLALPEGTRFTGKSEVSLAAAQRFVANGNYGLGIETYRRYLSANPEDAKAVEGLAIAYDRLQRFDLSDRYFQQALALAPRDPEIYTAYGKSLRSQGKNFDADLLDVDMRAMLAQDAPNAGIAAIDVHPPAISAPVVAASQAIVPAAPSGAVTRNVRLERSSAAEVRLVLPPDTVATSYGAVRRDPVAAAPPTPPALLPTRIVNAAGRQGIARRIQIFLGSRGWSRVDTGNSAVRLGESRIVFPVGSGDAARRLARALPFRTRLYPSSRAGRLQLFVGGNAVSFDARLKRR
ncbi:LytR C-terminal domain-containing protein [Sphingomonas sp. UNC305MFCol5.2]|uniref:LytR C-terminal domain-containing protein n=1 Tax=Sphingomonas sp. UNC305MFCol5.2 TaxID=1449076 RepID=UPI0003F67CD0|nr:LytR C-terminal domain-containing protein [Sphingomonas sp. UNC305MFCol5.2]